MLRTAALHDFFRGWRKLGLVGAIAGSFLLLITAEDGLSAPELLLLALGAFYILILILVVLVLPTRQFSTMTPMRGEMSYRFFPDRFEADTAAGSGEQTWLYRVRRYKSLSLLYVNAYVYLILPRIGFDSEQEYEEVIRIAKSLAEHN